jgi:hypothetical protein
VAAYEALIRDPYASLGRACWWVFLAGLLGVAIWAFFIYGNFMNLLNQINQLIQSGQFNQLNPSDQFNQLSQLATTSKVSTYLILALVWLVPIGAGFRVLGLLLWAAIFTGLAKLFRGSGNFPRTTYLLAAYSAPLDIVTSILAIIPLVNCLTIPLSLYTCWLNIIAVRVAHRLDSGRATIVVLLPSLVLIILSCIFLAVAWPMIRAGLPSSQNLPH